MNAVRQFLRNLVFENFGFKLLSFVFAVLVWFWVESDHVLTQRVRVSVAWKLPDGMVLTQRPVETATVTLEAVQATLRSIRQRELRIDVDLSQAVEGEVAVDLAERPVVGLPGQARVVSVSPADLRVTIDRSIKRRLEVVGTLVGDVAPGHRLAGTVVEPDRVEVIGPATLLRTLTRVATEEVDVSSLKEDTEFSDVTLALPRGTVKPLGTGRVKVSVSVEAIQEKRKLEDVMVIVQPEGRYRPVASSVGVELEGPISALGELDVATVTVVVQIPEGFNARTGVARAGDRGLSYKVVHSGDSRVVGRVLGTGIGVELADP